MSITCLIHLILLNLIILIFGSTSYEVPLMHFSPASFDFILGSDILSITLFENTLNYILLSHPYNTGGIQEI
jgi:hypothetical protein